ncbi:MAG: hypothetical protein HC933_21725 [Pleurocapsa sp. SU_196_0]|nr:hypothetical protein [Pleurocapsa sp. SU_196_0]
MVRWRTCRCRSTRAFPADTFTATTFGSNATYSSTFATPGQRTVTVRVTVGARTTEQTLLIDAVNTAPSLSLTRPSPIYPYGNGNAASFFLSITDPNESDPSSLCARTRWEVNLPDLIEANTITNVIEGGCTQRVRFASSGSRSLTIRVTDADGLPSDQTFTINVEEPPANPNPVITGGGVKRWDRLASDTITCLFNAPLSNGVTLDLTAYAPSKDCNGNPNPTTYQGFVGVQNPDHEPLTYTWRLWLVTPSNVVNTQSGTNTDYAVPFLSYGTGGTFQCGITVQVFPQDVSRAKSQQVWTGQCNVRAVTPN